MDKTRAQEQLLTNWVAIILAVLSIIQGLAFNNLVVQFPDIYQFARTTGDVRVVVHFGLCFVLLLRIFQTYVTAALDYNPWFPNFFDVLIIFIVGALEYFLFSTLKVPATFSATQFHARLTVISVLGIVGYLGALIRLREDLYPAYREYAREVRLQVINILGVTLVLGVSVLVMVFPGMNVRTQIGLVSIAIATLVVNTLLSLKTTFYGSHEEITPVATGSAPTQLPASLGTKKMDVFFKVPEREDAAEFANLFVEHFGYFYSAIFDTSQRLTRKILKRLLVVNRGNHALGYKAFFVACEQASGRMLGFFMVSTKESNGRGKTILGFLGALVTVLFEIGLVGLLRSYRNLRKLGSLVPTTAPDEMRVVYFAVAPDSRRRGVGKQMLLFIESMARSLHKRSVTLEVRETNLGAQLFFKAAGFQEDLIIKSPGDAMLELGHRIRMTTRVT